MTSRRRPVKVGEALRLACLQAGLNPRGAVLLRHFANAVFLVDGVVARVASGADAIERSTRALAVTHWLSGQGFPVTEPIAELHPSRWAPLVVPSSGANFAVTFWTYHRQPEDARPDFRVLGEIARHLHRIAGTPPVTLPGYEPLGSLRRVLAAPQAKLVLDTPTLRWLTGRATTLAEQVQTVESTLGVGLIHGDLYTGNLLVGNQQEWLLGDWDSVCIGPREVDLAPTAVAIRFGLDASNVAEVGEGYGFDVRDWPGFPLLREIRELSTLSALIRLAGDRPDSASELALRLNSLRNGDTTVLWHRQ